MKITGIGQEKIHDYDDERSATIWNRSVTIKTKNRPLKIVGGRFVTTHTGARFSIKTLVNSPLRESTEVTINGPQGHLANVGTTSYVYVCDPEKRPTTTTMNTATSAYVYDAPHRHLVMTVNGAVVQTLAVVVHGGGSADAKWLQGKHLCSVAELTGSVGGRAEWYVDELLATQTSASNNDISGYTLCANEWESFALPSTCDVAYGAKGSFAFRSAQSGTITFTNATFGDPAPGAPKKGYYRLSGGQRFYAHANSLYSIAALTNAAGAVVERYRYSSYGERTVLAADGITVRAASAYNQQVGFTGRFHDQESGLTYFRSRYSSTILGRFINRMPWQVLSDGTVLSNYDKSLVMQPFTGILMKFKFSYQEGRYNSYDQMKANPAWGVEPFSPGPVTPVLVGGGAVLGEIAVGTGVGLAAVETIATGVFWVAGAVGLTALLAGDTCKDPCAPLLVICLNNKFNVPPDHPFGRPLDCGACYRECKNAGGVWPTYKCPLP